MSTPDTHPAGAGSAPAQPSAAATPAQPTPLSQEELAQCIASLQGALEQSRLRAPVQFRLGAAVRLDKLLYQGACAEQLTSPSVAGQKPLCSKRTLRDYGRLVKLLAEKCPAEGEAPLHKCIGWLKKVCEGGPWLTELLDEHQLCYAAQLRPERTPTQKWHRQLVRVKKRLMELPPSEFPPLLEVVEEWLRFANGHGLGAEAQAPSPE